MYQNENTAKKMIALVGAGSFAREVYHQMKDNDPSVQIQYFADTEYCTLDDVMPLQMLHPRIYEVYICVSDPNIRKHFVEKLSDKTNYGIFIHKSAQILDKSIFIGRGTIICAGTIITTNVHIGQHCQLNLQTSIGHDTILEPFVTTAPKVSISGNCHINQMTYLGTGCAIKEGITIAQRSLIGMGAMVVKNIEKEGKTWVGVPAKELK